MKNKFYSIRGYAILMYEDEHRRHSIRRWLNRLDYKKKKEKYLLKILK